MLGRAFGRKLIGLGLIALLAAIAWWSQFYGEVQRFLGGKGALPVECLYQTGGPCSVITAAARWAGVTPYEPMLFLTGAASLVAGIVLSIALRLTDNDTGPPHKPWGDDDDLQDAAAPSVPAERRRL